MGLSPRTENPIASPTISAATHRTGIINSFTLIQTTRAMTLPAEGLLLPFEREGAFMKNSSPSTSNAADLGLIPTRLSHQARRLFASPIICSLEDSALALNWYARCTIIKSLISSAMFTLDCSTKP